MKHRSAFTTISKPIFLYQLLSAFLKKELHLLPVSEMGKFHTLVLNLFGVTVKSHFKQKSGHSNETVHRTPIDRRLKALLNEGIDGLLRPTTSEL